MFEAREFLRKKLIGKKVSRSPVARGGGGVRGGEGTGLLAGPGRSISRARVVPSAGLLLMRGSVAGFPFLLSTVES